MSAGLLWWKRKQYRNLVSSKLHEIKKRSKPAAVNDELTKTAGLDQTMPIAIPGYLELKLNHAVNMDKVSGSGGTARVVTGKLKDPSLVAKHNFLDVAVKFLNEASKFEDFTYEVTIMSALPKSAYIVELVGYSLRPQAIVMKSYPTSLLQILETADDTTSFQVKSGLALDIAKGMELIHLHGIIHFDLKPANVLIEGNADGSLTAVICDFGFANFSSDAKVNVVKGIKAPTTVGITARFAAPELFRPVLSRLENEIFKKVDVFAYAMTIFNIFTGEKPWKHTDLTEIEKNVLAGERPVIPASLPNRIKEIIETGWAPDPTERPSFSDILRKLAE